MLLVELHGLKPGPIQALGRCFWVWVWAQVEVCVEMWLHPMHVIHCYRLRNTVCIIASVYPSGRLWVVSLEAGGTLQECESNKL